MRTGHSSPPTRIAPSKQYGILDDAAGIVNEKGIPGLGNAFDPLLLFRVIEGLLRHLKIIQ